MKNGSEGETLLRVSEAALRLKVSRSKLYSMMRAGELAYTKLGRCRRIPIRELQRLIRKNTGARIADGAGSDRPAARSATAAGDRPNS